jgi:hypothetical protein
MERVHGEDLTLFEVLKSSNRRMFCVIQLLLAQQILHINLQQYTRSCSFHSSRKMMVCFDVD